MDPSSAPQLMLIVLLLLVSSSTTGSLSGNSAITAVVHDLHCVNDYVSTISCSLSLEPPHNSTHNSTSYWLSFKRDDEYVCMMSHTGGHYSCSFDVNQDVEEEEIFVDTDVFEIWLCHSEGEPCRLLEGEFELVTQIQPKPPCCLTVHNSSPYVFSWQSGYEEHLPFYNKVDFLMYQLLYYQRGEGEEEEEGQRKVTSVSTDDRNLSVSAAHFVADADYVVVVRSSPNQVYYRGQWSRWSPQVHWRTERRRTDSGDTPSVSGLDVRVVTPLCVLVLLFLFLCFCPLKGWKSGAFIPTPAPYFQSLYSDHQGDFQRWVVTPGKRADEPAEEEEVEESLQIHALTKCEQVHEEEEEEESPHQHHYVVMKGSLYSNMSDLSHPSDPSEPSSSTPSLPGLPYAACSDPGSGSGPSGSPAGDSGCWISNNCSFEKDAPWYNNEYCTLNAFHRCHTAAAQQQERAAASRDYQNQAPEEQEDM
ncbi:interleukin-21 receptor isoform X2 [Genypterus blacodes]|uniref:interleukin-21 receptor isoform X2 n=1 Tax=Genypterus blacodes TaxID=154954 RepID=UPI003F773994